MKINWGTGVVGAFLLFMSFIMYFVIKVQSNSKYDNELVVEEYYKHDAVFDSEMSRIQKAHDLSQKPILNTVSDGILITFPSVYLPQKISGTVSLYRPSSKKLDFVIPIAIATETLLIPKSKLIEGRWDIAMEWTYEKNSFLTKETIYYSTNK